MLYQGDKKFRFKSSHLIFVALVCMAIALVYVWFHLNITRLNYEIAREMERKGRLTEETRRLKIEIATLKSPHRIEKIALDELGMTYPKKEQEIFVK